MMVAMLNDAISIHPPRVGWDADIPYGFFTKDISIHPPRVGWDSSLEHNTHRKSAFQSTHPAWGGTHKSIDHSYLLSNFNPPTPRGVGLWRVRYFTASVEISIHPPRVGWDCGACGTLPPAWRFQSTHPAWGGTGTAGKGVGKPECISIHPPRVGWDTGMAPQVGVSMEISIHPPRVGWDRCRNADGRGCDISIHPPRVGWDTMLYDAMMTQMDISIHPPRVGWDAAPGK